MGALAGGARRDLPGRTEREERPVGARLLGARSRPAGRCLAARARRDIEQTKHNAVDELQQLAAKLSVDIASELIRKNLTVEDQQKLIEERIKQFPAA